MASSIHDKYLDASVRTATPQRRQLMLIEGAIRFARQAIEQWDGGLPSEDAYTAIVRCRDIVAEIYGATKQDQTPVAKQVAAIYLFLFRLLAEAPLHEDPQRVRDVIRVLEEERKTWQMVCEQMPETPIGATSQAGTSEEVTVRDALPPETPAGQGGIPIPGLEPDNTPINGRFSLDA